MGGQNSFDHLFMNVACIGSINSRTWVNHSFRTNYHV